MLLAPSPPLLWPGLWRERRLRQRRLSTILLTVHQRVFLLVSQALFDSFPQKNATPSTMYQGDPYWDLLYDFPRQKWSLMLS